MRFKVGKVFLIGFGFLGISVIWGMYNAFVPVFLSQKFHMDVVWVGFFMSLDNIAALLIQAPTGAWSDRLHTSIGRRMPFILIGAPMSAIAFGLIPSAAALPLFIACTTTLLISMAFWRIPVTALMPDITPSRYLSQANGILNFLGGVGSLLAFIVGARLYELHPAYAFWAGSLLVVTAAMLVFLFIREPIEHASSTQKPGLWRSLVESLRDPDRSVVRLFLAIFFWNLSFGAVEAFYNLYAIHHLGITAANGSRLLGEFSLIFLLFSLPAGYIGGWLGRRRAIITGMMVAGLTFLTTFLLPPGLLLKPLLNLPVFGIILQAGTPAVLVGSGALIMMNAAGWALIVINALPMMMDMGDSAHFGTYTGLYYLFAQFSAIIGPNITGWLIRLTGGNYNSIFFSAPLFLLIAAMMISAVKRGEAVKSG